MENAAKNIPSHVDAPPMLSTNVLEEYLPWYMWHFEVIGGFGRNSRLFSLGGSDRRRYRSTQPWKVYLEIEEEKLKPTQIASNRPENQTGHK